MTSAAYTDALERALGRVIAEARRDAERDRELAGAALSAIKARVAEAEAWLDRATARSEALHVSIEERVAAFLAGIPAPKDGRDGAPGEKGEKGDPGERGRDGTDGRDADPEAIRRLVDEAVADLPAPKDGRDADPEVIRRLVDEAVADLPAPKDGRDGAAGEKGEKGDPGEIGRLEAVRSWADVVHYAGAVVTHGGGTWQAVRDTGRAPPHEDWACLAAPGARGEDGRSLTFHGPYSAEADYRSHDVVMVGGSSFVAVRDEPGACPGDGWRLLAGGGSRGAQGKAGPKGDPGRPGAKGEPGASLVALTVDDDWIVTATNDDGSEVTLDLYPRMADILERLK